MTTDSCRHAPGRPSFRRSVACVLAVATVPTLAGEAPRFAVHEAQLAPRAESVDGRYVLHAPTLRAESFSLSADGRFALIPLAEAKGAADCGAPAGDALFRNGFESN